MIIQTSLLLSCFTANFMPDIVSYDHQEKKCRYRVDPEDMSGRLWSQRSDVKMQ